MQIQLRIYTINRGALQTFAQEWKSQIYPLRVKTGFRVVNARTVEASNQFVWPLAYDGPESWEARDQAYYQSDERRAMVPDPARNIARIEHYFVETVLTENTS